MSLSDRIRHWFHVVSNVRPIVWIGTYVALMPVFAFIYYILPDGQFRIPDGGTTDFGSWLYYSIVTITTLGFGDYTPAHGWAQGVTAAEVMCGLIILGFFLNAVGSMKSEIDVTAEVEKQRKLHEAQQTDKLVKSIPAVMHCINTFMAYCYAVTTPLSERKSRSEYNPDFKLADMADIYKESGLPDDLTGASAIEGFNRATYRTSLCLDSLQSRVDLAMWPELLEDSFTFVANCQIFSSVDNLRPSPQTEKQLADRIAGTTQAAGKSDAIGELYAFIKENAAIARKIETELTKISSTPTDQTA